LTKALRTARILEEPSTAAMLLKPFRLELLAPSHAKALSALLEAYGTGGRQIWSDHGQPGGSVIAPPAHSTEVWIASLQRLCTALADCGGPGSSAALLLLRDSWRWIRKAIEQALGLPSPSRRDKALAEFGRPVAALLQGASLVDAADVVGEATGFICRDDEDLVGCAVEVLRAAPAQGWGAAGLNGVADHCRHALEERLTRPPRSADNWSIQLPGGCRCDLCSTLSGFLADPARRIFEWPLAKDRRVHVHSRIDSAELSVNHETIRKGSPYTLVLTKTDALFEREKQDRLRDEVNLAWIRKTRASGSKRR
jgi:hypothetical protein